MDETNVNNESSTGSDAVDSAEPKSDSLGEAGEKALKDERKARKDAERRLKEMKAGFEKLKADFEDFRKGADEQISSLTSERDAAEELAASADLVISHFGTSADTAGSAMPVPGPRPDLSQANSGKPVAESSNPFEVAFMEALS